MSHDPFTEETMTDQPVIPAAGSYRPGAMDVRLACPPDVMATVLVSLSGL